jgi:hypothetical protein
MSNDMIGRVVKMLVAAPGQYLGAIADLLEKLSGQAGTEWFTALGQFLNKRNAWGEKKSILRLLSTVEVKGAKTFVANTGFRIDTDPSRDVRISSLGDSFKRDYLPKVEENVEDAILRIHELLEGSRDIPIVAELGNEEGVEISLVHFHGVLAAKQAAGDTTWIVGYIRDKNGVLGVVYAIWHGSWNVHSNSLGSSRKWGAGYPFLSRNSVPLAA